MLKKQILVPLDQSPEAEAALPYAEALAKTLGSELRLFSVVQTELEGPLFRRIDMGEEVVRLQQAQADAYLAKVAVGLQLPGRGIDVQGTVVLGEPTEQILSAAGDDVAMVVMATHGRGSLGRVVLGSVADKVMRMSQRPTLLVHALEAPRSDRSVTLRRIVVPLDGSLLAEVALPQAIELARSANAGLILVNVEPYVPLELLEGDEIPDVERWHKLTSEGGKAYLEHVEGHVPTGVHVMAEVLHGPVEAVLEDFVKNQSIDLVVMSTHGRSGLRRVVLGSTAERLVRAGVPTLLIHPTARAERNEPAQQGTVAAP